jgi:hypothetical protein
MLCPLRNNFCYNNLGIFIGDLAMFNQRSAMLSHKEFPSSCTLVEMDGTVTNTIASNNIGDITGQDGLIYSKRTLALKIEFRSGLFMKMEQRKDYSGS